MKYTLEVAISQAIESQKFDKLVAKSLCKKKFVLDKQTIITSSRSVVKYKHCNAYGYDYTDKHFGITIPGINFKIDLKSKVNFWGFEDVFIRNYRIFIFLMQDNYVCQIIASTNDERVIHSKIFEISEYMKFLKNPTFTL